MMTSKHEESLHAAQLIQRSSSVNCHSKKALRSWSYVLVSC